MNNELFPFATHWWFYGGFTAVVILLLALDLGVFHRKAHAVSFREAAAWCVVWVSLALAFNFGLYQYTLAHHGEETARRIGLEFLAGYLVEESLSLDNIFVFVLLFRYFAIPAEFQHRVLFYGILGAIVMRGIFIAAGAALIRYHWVVMAFGLFLVVTGIRMMFAGDRPEPGDNPMLKLLRRFLPVTGSFEGAKLLTRLPDGRRAATPLMVALVCVETTDLLFAIDSVPAVFALTREPLVVFTSNIFAILGLRSLYFLLAGAVDRFHLLKYGLALVLIFVGLKMTVFTGLPIAVSLGAIAGILAVSIGASLILPPPAPVGGAGTGTACRPGGPAPAHQ